jgi:hypothetical protein
MLVVRQLLRLLDGLVSQAIVLDERNSELSVMQQVGSDTLEAGVNGGTVELPSILSAMDVSRFFSELAWAFVQLFVECRPRVFV